MLGSLLAEVKQISRPSSQSLQQSNGHRDSPKKGQVVKLFNTRFQGNLYFHKPTLENAAIATDKAHPFTFLQRQHTEGTMAAPSAKAS